MKVRKQGLKKGLALAITAACLNCTFFDAAVLYAEEAATPSYSVTEGAAPAYSNENLTPEIIEERLKSDHSTDDPDDAKTIKYSERDQYPNLLMKKPSQTHLTIKDLTGRESYQLTRAQRLEAQQELKRRQWKINDEAKIETKAAKEREKELKKLRNLRDSNRQKYSLQFDPSAYVKKTMVADGTEISFRAYENIVYTGRPMNAEYEKMSIYIPEAYFSGGTVNGYTAEEAPIFMPNGVGGYMPGEIAEPSEADRMTGKPNASLLALARGYVVAAPAIRGRTLKDPVSGLNIGKAPALIVDYKAAVRYLRHNKDLLPAGDTERIISSGTSAGGALSALLGATGNAPEYEEYLKEIKAADERDDIFASMCYCPITNLDHADAAYEWIFNGVNSFYGNAADMAGNAPAGGEAAARPQNAPGENKTATALTDDQIKASAELKEHFIDYLNALHLSEPNRTWSYYSLDKAGNGIFKEYIKSLYKSAAQKALDNGNDIYRVPWLTVSYGEVIDVDLAKYATSVKRLKTVPAFDHFENNSGENSEFGNDQVDSQHFTTYAFNVGQGLHKPGNTPAQDEAMLAEKAAQERGTVAEDSYAMPESEQNATSSNIDYDPKDLKNAPRPLTYRQPLMKKFDPDKVEEEKAAWNEIKAMNPMYFIGREDVNTAPNWRIRHGSHDRDTVLAIPAILALKLSNTGSNVDFAVAWGQGHAGDYDLDDLFVWIDSVCKNPDVRLPSTADLDDITARLDKMRGKADKKSRKEAEKLEKQRAEDGLTSRPEPSTSSETAYRTSYGTINDSIVMSPYQENTETLDSDASTGADIYESTVSSPAPVSYLPGDDSIQSPVPPEVQLATPAYMGVFDTGGTSTQATDKRTVKKKSSATPAPLTRDIDMDEKDLALLAGTAEDNEDVFARTEAQLSGRDTVETQETQAAAKTQENLQAAAEAAASQNAISTAPTAQKTTTSSAATAAPAKASALKGVDYDNVFGIPAETARYIRATRSDKSETAAETTAAETAEAPSGQAAPAEPEKA